MPWVCALCGAAVVHRRNIVTPGQKAPARACGTSGCQRAFKRRAGARKVGAKVELGLAARRPASRVVRAARAGLMGGVTHVPPPGRLLQRVRRAPESTWCISFPQRRLVPALSQQFPSRPPTLRRCCYGACALSTGTLAAAGCPGASSPYITTTGNRTSPSCSTGPPHHERLNEIACEFILEIFSRYSTDLSGPLRERWSTSPSMTG